MSSAGSHLEDYRNRVEFICFGFVRTHLKQYIMNLIPNDIASILIRILIGNFKPEIINNSNYGPIIAFNKNNKFQSHNTFVCDFKIKDPSKIEIENYETHNLSTILLKPLINDIFAANTLIQSHTINLKLLRNNCTYGYYANGGYFIQLGLIFIEKDKISHDRQKLIDFETKLRDLESIERSSYGLNNLAKKDETFRNVQSFYIKFGCSRYSLPGNIISKGYHCRVGIGGLYKFLSLYDSMIDSQNPFNIDELYHITDKDSKQNDNNEITMNLSFDKDENTCILTFAKNGITILDGNVEGLDKAPSCNMIIKDGKILLDLDKYYYYYAMGSNRCGCSCNFDENDNDNDKDNNNRDDSNNFGFEFEISM